MQPCERSKALWQCPTCGRVFARANQAHSCQARTVESHFCQATPKAIELFAKLVDVLKGLGEYRMDAAKAGVNFVHRRHFGGVRFQRDALRLGFLSSAPIESPRILRSERIGPNRIHNSTRVDSLDQIDDELIGWLREAHALQA